MKNYGKNWKELALFLASLLRYKGLTIHQISLGNRIKATSFMKDYGLDYDGTLAAQALDLSADTIVSYDEDFNSVDWIKRQAPEDLL